VRQCLQRGVGGGGDEGEEGIKLKEIRRVKRMMADVVPMYANEALCCLFVHMGARCVTRYRSHDTVAALWPLDG